MLRSTYSTSSTEQPHCQHDLAIHTAHTVEHAVNHAMAKNNTTATAHGMHMTAIGMQSASYYYAFQAALHSSIPLDSQCAYMRTHEHASSAGHSQDTCVSLTCISSCSLLGRTPIHANSPHPCHTTNTAQPSTHRHPNCPQHTTHRPSANS